MLWLGFVFVLIVYWLVGHALARVIMILVMLTLSYFIATASWAYRDPSFILPNFVVCAVFSWWLAGIPHRYRKRRNVPISFERYIEDWQRHCRDAEQDRLVDERLARL